MITNWFRATFFFQHSSSPPCGFTESFEYLSATEEIAFQFISPYIKDRLLFLSEDWSIIGARVANLSAHKFTPPAPDPVICTIVQTMVTPYVCQVPRAGNLGPADTPWAAILLEIPVGKPQADLPPRPNGQPAKVLSRKMQIRGIPDSWWTANALTIPGADAGNIQEWISHLVKTWAVGHFRPNGLCTDLILVPYKANACIKRISNRQIGRPFGLLRGRRRALIPVS